MKAIKLAAWQAMAEERLAVPWVEAAIGGYGQPHIFELLVYFAPYARRPQTLAVSVATVPQTPWATT